VSAPKLAGAPLVARALNTRSDNALCDYVLRLFAYHGGPLAVDAVINGMASTTVPKRTKNLEEWFDDVLGQLLRTTAMAAASALEMNRKNMMQTVKWALRANAAVAKTGTESLGTQYEEKMEKILASINWSIAGG
jgi:hypothetical protein